VTAETIAALLGIAGAVGFVVGVIACGVGEALFRKYGKPKEGQAE